ncbi:TniQ family protein [Streptomyces sp. CFMR 7]|uniref:TniQ family protein n=1 Tax=Streptomyces sp. CFMR 7 TaxID=1649184 RepID=UPI0037D9AD1B
MAEVTGMTEDVLTAMTLQRFDGHAVVIQREQRRVRPQVLWGRAGSRFCPTCLTDSGGRWQITWRLGWSFACARHHVLLADRCPACQRIPRLRAHPRPPVPDGAQAPPPMAGHDRRAATTPWPTPRSPRSLPTGLWHRRNASSTASSRRPAARWTGRCTGRPACPWKWCCAT